MSTLSQQTHANTTSKHIQKDANNSVIISKNTPEKALFTTEKEAFTYVIKDYVESNGINILSYNIYGCEHIFEQNIEHFDSIL